MSDTTEHTHTHTFSFLTTNANIWPDFANKNVKYPVKLGFQINTTFSMFLKVCPVHIYWKSKVTWVSCIFFFFLGDLLPQNNKIRSSEVGAWPPAFPKAQDFHVQAGLATTSLSDEQSKNFKRRSDMLRKITGKNRLTSVLETKGRRHVAGSLLRVIAGIW